MPDIILGCTGHRSWFHPADQVRIITKAILVEISPKEIITGVALGFDQLIAELAMELNIPFIAAVPFLGQENLWPNIQQVHYHNLLKNASKVVIVSEGGYEPWKLHFRNEWIVNNCSQILAYWNGTKTGGTAHCLKYAKKVNKSVRFIKV